MLARAITQIEVAVLQAAKVEIEQRTDSQLQIFTEDDLDRLELNEDSQGEATEPGLCPFESEVSMPLDEIIRFYDATFDAPTLQGILSTATDLDIFKNLILEEAANGGFTFSRAELDATFDGFGETDIDDNVDFNDPWIARIMRYGWVPKGYSR